ncbi:TonB-dependent receptor plug domain-containing protein [Hyunsoonleella sp. SJ7]|uniref:TonB-dependent receptor plug domain-containing protein n=1 Tax=Hyunsoonleella aquatilis TaxID=2762758 RepID=A0A923HDZ2_9FLAO|nr:TonB-dependent receptor plug domain-containing protein [Hyunsoonleella aquatilis]MBC3757680.1 TonB-dependent receptor plug domain-containing protein [Hyunsoonleella aquatilis]
MKKRIRKFIFLFVLILNYGAYAQEEHATKPLVDIISNLETRFEIQFNYSEDLVRHISCKIPADSLSLTETLDYLQKSTGLLFGELDSRIVLVKAKPKRRFCGHIRDIETQLPIVGAVIIISEERITSDQNGYFEIDPNQISYPITIQYFGYETLEIDSAFEIDDCTTIKLVPNFQQLSEVLISNYLVNGINKLKNGSFEIDFNDFDILPGLIESDVLQSVQGLPGIQSINETVSNINIRGGTHDQNLIRWDGIKMYQSGHFFGLISMYNPEITQQVSLRKNGSSVTLTDGVSGTIDMRTDKNLNSKFKGVVGANLLSANGFADVPLGSKSSIQVAGRKALSPVVETPTYSSFFDRISQNTEVAHNQMDIINSNQSFDFYDASFRWLYQLSKKDKLRLNFITVFNELVFDENAMVNNLPESRRSSLSQFSIAGVMHYERTWNNKLKTALEIYNTDYELKSINANIFEGQRFLQENKVSETSTKLSVNHRINSRLEFLGGYHLVETKVTNLDDVDDPIFRDLVSEVLRTHGVFSQIGYASNDKKTNLNFGLRFNYLSKFKRQLWEPRLSFSHMLSADITWEVLGEFKHQSTSQVINFQNDFLGVEKRRWQLSNDKGVPIITSRQLSSGLTLNKNGWLFSLDGYLKDVKGITSQSQGFQNQFEFSRETGSYTVTGFDVLLRKAIGNFNSWLSYAYMNNKYTFNTLFEERFPSNFDISHLVTFGSVLKLKNLKLSMGVNWHSGRPTTNPILGNEFTNSSINYQTPNSDSLKNYFRLDVSAIYDFTIGKKAKANLGVSIWNLLDKENEINNFHRVNNDAVINTIQNSLGITPNAVLRLSF